MTTSRGSACEEWEGLGLGTYGTVRLRWQIGHPHGLRLCQMIGSSALPSTGNVLEISLILKPLCFYPPSILFPRSQTLSFLETAPAEITGGLLITKSSGQLASKRVCFSPWCNQLAPQFFLLMSKHLEGSLAFNTIPFLDLRPVSSFLWHSVLC